VRKKKKKKIEDRKKLQGKNIFAPLLHRAPYVYLIFEVGSTVEENSSVFSLIRMH